MAAKKKSATRKTTPANTSVMSRKIRSGFISHTEIASADPSATKKWAEQALASKFGNPMPTPSGPYHMWHLGKSIGGGLSSTNRTNHQGEPPHKECPGANARDPRE